MIYNGKLTDIQRQQQGMERWNGLSHVVLDETGRILSASDDFGCGENELTVKLPADLPAFRAFEYRVVDGVAIHDPLPVEETSGETTPSIEEIIDILLGVES